MITTTMFALAAAASPIAAEPREAPVVAPAAMSQPVPKRATRYCTEYTPTGSHIERSTCRTRDEWLALGFDPLASK